MIKKTAAALAMTALFSAPQALAGEAMLGIYQHDIMDGISHGGHFEHGKDIVIGVRTASLDELGIGGAIHTGSVDLPSPFDAGLSPAVQQARLRDWQTKLDLGSRVLFEPEFSLGWKATDRMSFEVSWIHMSHGQLAGPQNPGLGDFGFRAVYRYGVDRSR